MSGTLRLLAFAAAAAVTACTEIPLPPPPLFLVPYELSTNAVVDSVTEIDPAGYCDTARGACRAYVVNLAPDSEPTRCPVVAIEDRDANGYRDIVWPETLLGAKGERWNLVGRRSNHPRCHFALVNATRDPR